MKWIQYVRVSIVVLSIGFPAGEARADEGIIQLREDQGPYTVTIFTASEPVQGAPVDFSVMVQRRDSSDAILDANVSLRFTGLASAEDPFEQLCGQPGIVFLSRISKPSVTQILIPATREQASNKLLYAAPFRFATAGNWQLEAFIEYGNDAAKVTCNISVGTPPRALPGLYPYLALPPLIMVLFAVNQYLRRQSLGKIARESPLF